MPSAFRFLLAAEVVSNFGAMLSRLAIPWLAALALDVTPFQMGFLVVADVIAGAAGSLVLGVMVDRMDKRAVMIATDLGRATVLGALAWLAVQERLAFPMLVAAAAASGIMTVMFELARSAWIAQRVPVDELPRRNAQMSMGTSLSETVAFAIGGWIYQALGAVLALVVDARELRRLRAARAQRARRARERRERAAIDPARDARRSPRGHARDRRRADPAHARRGGVLVALAMSIAGHELHDLRRARHRLRHGHARHDLRDRRHRLARRRLAGPRMGARWACAARCWRARAPRRGRFCIPLAHGATIFGAALLVTQQVIGDGGHVVFDIHDRTLRQTAVAPGLLARVDAGIRTLGQLARLAGAVGGGLIATAIGTRSALVLSAAIYVVAFLVVRLQSGEYT
jgi:MFS family permease